MSNTLLGNLRVRLTAETEDFRRGMDSARNRVGSFQKELTKLSASTIAQVASVGAVTAALRKSLEVAKEYDSVTGALAASARTTGQELRTLNAIVDQSRELFGLSRITAHQYTQAIANLADRAGGLAQPTRVLESFLDLGASRGLSAADSLKLLTEGVKGSEEAFEGFFNRKPTELYNEFAASIGKAGAQLSEQERAQALVHAALEQGKSVRGEYGEWLKSVEGRQFALSQGMQDSATILGKTLQPAVLTFIPVLDFLSKNVARAVGGFQMTLATLSLIPAAFRAVKLAATEGMGAAREEMARATAEVRQRVADIKAMVEGTTPTLTVDLALSGRGAIGGAGGAEGAGREAARGFVTGLEDEWERLRHEIRMRQIELGGTDAQRLALEEEHALSLLDIEERHMRERARLGELNARELQDSLAQLSIRREIAQARRAETEAVLRTNEAIATAWQREDNRLSDRIERERIMGQAALSRLGTQGTIAERLRVQLNLSERVYRMQREAIERDGRLTDMQRDIELERLRLAREREQIQLRTLAAVEKEARVLDKQRAIRGDLEGRALDLATSVIRGTVDGAEIGTAVAGAAGTLIGGPMAGMIAGELGGVLGRLLDPQEEGALVPQLSAIERAQRETITAIEKQTTDLLQPQNRLYNVPSSFNVPQQLPALATSRGGATTTTYVTDRRQVQVVFNMEASRQTPEEIKRFAMEGVTEALNSGRRNSARGVRRT